MLPNRFERYYRPDLWSALALTPLRAAIHINAFGPTAQFTRFRGDGPLRPLPSSLALVGESPCLSTLGLIWGVLLDIPGFWIVCAIPILVLRGNP